MARMAPAEATAVNVLCTHFAASGDLPPVQVVKALEMLASRAHNRLQHGWDEDEVRRQWPHAYDDTTG